MIEIHLTSSQKRLVSEWLKDLSLKIGKDPEKISSEVLSTLSLTENAGKKQRGEHYFKKIRELRFPELSACEKRFSNKVNDLFKADPHMRKFLKISHSENFEEEQILIEVALSQDNLDNVIDFLNLKREELRNLIL